VLIREDPGNIFWRRQLFRDGVPWYYQGVLHEFANCDEPFTDANLCDDLQIHSRRLGARGKDPEKWAKDAAVLLAYVSDHPDDERSVFFLAQSSYHALDFENGRTWYARRVEMGDWEDAATLTGAAAPAETTRTNPGTGRYVLTDPESHCVTHGPNMVDVNRLRTSSDGTRFAGATLDEVLCIRVR
jgi:hypothetical protein